ncbi:NADPH2:quinone reductase [Paenibacillus sp. SORGH_AS306]|uniref:zinc-binding alcohol dehydrogenase family protein n=1 Tax=unclassified Paenibacillus TaxID=185978 RepID=UPI002785E0C6|nr:MULTISPECIES: zinc-binding alcohol dehydrogenase family protein [unclassified Paenibacillus]MDQ1236239.1 NADPH2:quinone reductase [Paenibacillus sp. SORGH_AS_0306]MDR6108593.1 NADPH2:quinone reductase [Paenibacillus sp. SORGH_AS_0338]
MSIMKAVGVTRYLPIDQPDSLLDVEIPKPSASGRDLLVQVQAISVNPVDTKIRAPKDQVEENPRILGWDVAGTVVEVGEHVTDFQIGDEVFYAGSVTRAGGNSEYHLVDERIVGHKPKSLDFAAAAALPLTSLTAWEAIHERLGISEDASANSGQTILIINAAGGVGSIATQIAQQAGLTVIGTASRSETTDWARAHGADHVINHHDEFVPQLQKIGISDVNYILCLNHTDQHWQHMADAIAPQGKICSIVETEQPIDLEALKNKSATFVWEFMFTRSMYETDDMNEQGVILNRIATQIDEGKLRTTETKRLRPINTAQLQEAHRLLEAGDMIGKLVLEGFES